MLEIFRAQSLLETKETEDNRTFELTFVDAQGARKTLALSRSLAKDLIPVLVALAGGEGNERGPKFTKRPKDCMVGHATNEQLVLIKFDDDPPYALRLEDARALSRELNNESENVSLRRPALLQ